VSYSWDIIVDTDAAVARLEVIAKRAAMRTRSETTSGRARTERGKVF
jgi:hypothetical protein